MPLCTLTLYKAPKYLDCSIKVVSERFGTWSVWQKLVYVALSGRVVLAKYLGVWLMNEGSCAVCGISYNGPSDKKNEYRFDGLRNIDPVLYESVTSLGHIISSFNMNTNSWCKYYVFKRLRFLSMTNICILY